MVLALVFERAGLVLLRKNTMALAKCRRCGVVFQSTNLVGANLTGVNLHNTYGWSLPLPATKTNLTNAMVANSSMLGVRVSNAILSSAAFTGSNTWS